MRKQELMFAILKKKAKSGEQIFGDGTLEVLPDGFGFLRSPDTSYLASTDDIYISPSQIRRFNLHTGDSIEGEVRTPRTANATSHSCASTPSTACRPRASSTACCSRT